MPTNLQTTTANVQDKNLYHWLLLAMTNKVGGATVSKLIKHFGTVDNIYNQSQAVLSEIVNPTIARLIYNKESAHIVDESFKWVELSQDHHLISIENKLYPKELAQITNPPVFLFLKGNINQLLHNKFAIVGTRHPTEQGINNAYRFAKEVANNGFAIVSGMASGIDKAAHLGAIEGACSTIGIIGTGINQIYPKSNEELYKKVLDNNGLIVSEFPLNTQPLVSNFPRRNRIIAGMSLGLLVVESAIDGGSMISANLALDMGREVMALPGSIHNPVARGCHKLIKTGAKLIENTNDILEDLRPSSDILTYNTAFKENNNVLACMGYEPISIDEICSNLKMEFSDICADILELELSGKIVNCGCGRYQRIFT